MALYSTTVWSKTSGFTLSTSNQPWNVTISALEGGLKDGDVSDPLYGCGEVHPFFGS